MSVLNPKQAQFVATLSKLTGMDAKAIAAWTLAEESSGAASQRAKDNNNNWLNIGYFDSGPSGKITRDKTFGDPVSAARATAQFMRGQKWGASSGIQNIIKTAGKSPQAQLQAIANSGWASSGYNHGQNLLGTYKAVTGIKLPSGAPAQNQPIPPVPGMAPVSAPPATSAPIGTTTPDDAQLTIQSLLQSAKQHLGVPTPANPLLAQLMQGTNAVAQNSASAPPPLKLPSGAPAKTRLTATTPTVSTTTPARTPGGYTVGSFDGTKVASWMVPALQYARANGWKGSLTSGLRSTALQAQLYQKYLAGGNIAAKPGQSNHEIQNGGAFDATDPQQLWQILQGYKGKRPIYAPSVGLRDSVHFSINGH